MARKLGIREFRDSFTTIARKAKEPVIVTNHDRIVGWFTPASRPQRSIKEILATLDEVRRSTEASGVDVGARMKELRLEDEYLFEDPWVEARPAKAKRK